MKIVITRSDILAHFSSKFDVDESVIELETPPAAAPINNFCTLTNDQLDNVQILVAEIAQAVARSAVDNVSSDAAKCLDHANKITAIKAWRTLMGDGLKEAKDAVEKIMDTPARKAKSPNVW